MPVLPSRASGNLPKILYRLSLSDPKYFTKKVPAEREELNIMDEENVKTESWKLQEVLESPDIDDAIFVNGRGRLAAHSSRLNCGLFVFGWGLQ